MKGSIATQLLLAGVIAQALAAKDKDIEAARAAYQEQRFEDALASLERAKERRGERPEIAFDQGLLAMTQDSDEAAKKLFERATESTDEALRASANFQLGNLAFDAQDWAGAIEHYIECLKEAPLHEDAKWNLELALTKQQEEEKKKEQEQDKNQDQDQDQQDKEEQEDQESQDQEKDEPEEQDSGSSSSSGGESSEDEAQGSSSGGDASSSDQAGQGDETDQTSEQDQDQSSEQGDQGQSTAEPEPEPEPEQEQEQEQQQDDQQQSPQPGESEPKAPPKSNLDRALEDLDREDPFMFGMPQGRRRRVKEDW